VLRLLEPVALFDIPSENADELGGLRGVGQEGEEVVSSDAAAVEPSNKMIGSRLSSFVISVADTTSLLRGESSVEMAQSSGSGGR
jgi:hypothetical protein